MQLKTEWHVSERNLNVELKTEIQGNYEIFSYRTKVQGNSSGLEAGKRYVLLKRPSNG